jgi:hypothetical protein
VIKIVSGVQKFIGGAHRHTQRAWRCHKLTFIFINKESRLKNALDERTENERTSREREIVTIRRERLVTWDSKVHATATQVFCSDTDRYKRSRRPGEVHLRHTWSRQLYERKIPYKYACISHPRINTGNTESGQNKGNTKKLANRICVGYNKRLQLATLNVPLPFVCIL